MNVHLVLSLEEAWLVIETLTHDQIHAILNRDESTKLSAIASKIRDAVDEVANELPSD